MKSYLNQEHQQKVWAKTLNQTQGSLLAKSLSKAGLNLIVLTLLTMVWGCAFAFLFCVFYPSLWIIITLYFVGGLIIATSMIMSMIWKAKIKTASHGFIVMAFVVYILMQSLGFGLLFSLIVYNNTIPILFTGLGDLCLIFGLAGILFLFMALATRTMNKKKTITTNKLLIIGGIITICLMLFTAMMWLFCRFFWMSSLCYASGWFYFLILIITTPLMLCYVAFDIYLIKRMADFKNLQRKLKTNIISMFSFKLLVDLIGLPWVAISFFLTMSKGGKK